jgi:hypothetical protein
MMPKDKPKTCIFYIGVDYSHTDLSGDGTCIDAFTPNGKYHTCKDVIAEGKCSKHRTTPYD